MNINDECYIQVWDIKCKWIVVGFETVFITRPKNYPS